MNALTKFSKSAAGKIIVPASAVLLLALMAYQVKGFFGKSDAAAISDDRIFICNQTGKGFHVNLANLVGQSFPIYSPYSGKNTACPAELCYWTKDGKPKDGASPVLLNSYIGKAGPTFCPDCGRLVVGHNPLALPGMRSPTQAEYEATHCRDDNQEGAVNSLLL